MNFCSLEYSTGEDEMALLLCRLPWVVSHLNFGAWHQ
jgi:hypothetical protein